MAKALDRPGDIGEIIGEEPQPGLVDEVDPDTCSTEDWYEYEKLEPEIQVISEPIMGEKEIWVQGSPVAINFPGTYVQGVGWVGGYTQYITPSYTVKVPSMVSPGEYRKIEKVRVTHHYHCETFIEVQTFETVGTGTSLEGFQSGVADLVTNTDLKQFNDANLKNQLEQIAAAQEAAKQLQKQMQELADKAYQNAHSQWEDAYNQAVKWNEEAIQAIHEAVDSTLAMIRQMQDNRAAATDYGAARGAITTFTFGAIRDVYHDMNGNKWINTGNGISYLNPGTTFTSSTWPFKAEHPLSAGQTAIITGFKPIGTPLSAQSAPGVTVNYKQWFYPDVVVR